MTDLFSSPATATGLDLEALLGSLLLVDVHAVETGINTAFGPTDAIRGDVAVLDGTLAGQTYNDTLIFPKVLQSQLRSRVGGKVLGRLGKGTAKPGQSAPWVLSEPSEADRQLGMQWLSRMSAPAPAATQAPVQQAPAASAAGAGAPPPWAQQSA
jgi:hypothetical protein